MTSIQSAYNNAKQRHPLSEFGIYGTLMEYKHELSTAQRDRAKAFHDKHVLLSNLLDLRYDSDIKPHGGYSWEGPLPEWVKVEGMERKYLTLRVEVAVDYWYETVKDQIENAGYTMTPWERYDDEEDALRYRPRRYAVAFNYSTPRERSEWHWVYPKDREVADLGLPKAVLKGMDRHRKEVMQEAILRSRTEAFVGYLAKIMNETIENHCVTLQIKWRGEEVASDSLGGCEIDSSHLSRPMMSTDAQIALFILDNGLINQVVDEAEKWADQAVADIMAQVSALTESVVLLPERSRRAIIMREDSKVLQLKDKRRKAR